MGERGWGAPTLIGGANPSAEYDWGWGSPPGSTVVATHPNDTGWGSPRTQLIVQSVQLVLVNGVPWLPDSGGVMVRLEATWPALGPFRIRLRSGGGTPYPIEGGFCHGGQIGMGPDIYVKDTTTVDSLEFALPVVPVGAYDVEVLWGIGFGTIAIVPAILDVVFRNRSAPTYRIRRRMPSQPYKELGPLTARADTNTTAEFPKDALAVFTEAFGRLMESLIGRPTTKITTDFGLTATTMDVETTLGYPDAGKVWAGGYLIDYTAKTATTFTGCTSRARSMIVSLSTLVTLHLPSAPPG